MKLKPKTIENLRRYFSDERLQSVINDLEFFSEEFRKKNIDRFNYGALIFVLDDFEKGENMIETNHDLGHAPKHYEKACAKIEPREFLRMLPFQLGSACKYILRYNYKGHPIEDLKKALDYLHWAADDYEEPLSEKAFYIAPYFRNEIIDILFDYDECEINIDAAIDYIESMIEGNSDEN